MYKIHNWFTDSFYSKTFRLKVTADFHMTVSKVYPTREYVSNNASRSVHIAENDG